MKLKSYAVRGSVKDSKKGEAGIGRYIVDAYSEEEAIEFTRKYLKEYGYELGEKYWHARPAGIFWDRILGTKIEGVR